MTVIQSGKLKDYVNKHVECETCSCIFSIDSIEDVWMERYTYSVLTYCKCPECRKVIRLNEESRGEQNEVSD